MIKTFADKEAEKLFKRTFSKKLPQNIQLAARMKLEILDAAEVLLAKAATYNSEQLNEAVSTIKNEFRLENRVEKSQQDMTEKYDNSQLFHRNSMDEIRNNSKRIGHFDHSELDNDDSGSYEAKYFFFFITGLFE